MKNIACKNEQQNKAAKLCIVKGKLRIGWRNTCATCTIKAVAESGIPSGVRSVRALAEEPAHENEGKMLSREPLGQPPDARTFWHSRIAARARRWEGEENPGVWPVQREEDRHPHH